jgi:hypothetical protein
MNPMEIIGMILFVFCLMRIIYISIKIEKNSRILEGFDEDYIEALNNLNKEFPGIRNK